MNLREWLLSAYGEHTRLTSIIDIVSRAYDLANRYTWSLSAMTTTAKGLPGFWEPLCKRSRHEPDVIISAVRSVAFRSIEFGRPLVLAHDPEHSGSVQDLFAEVEYELYHTRRRKH